MAEESKVTLYGYSPCPFGKRVEMALKLKGVPYEYVEEDLTNNSQMLLSLNPVHKKVPVLVHNGKPIAQSLVILEYIDETWKNGPQLLPKDPYKRAQVRFWASFVQQQLFESMLKEFKTKGETQEEASKELFEKLKLLEEGLKSFYFDSDRSIDTEHVGLLDLVFVSVFGSYHKVQEEVLSVKTIDPEKSPLIHSWLTALLDLPVVKETLPPVEKMVAHIKFFRQRFYLPQLNDP
ncbi:hypothetical protein UlMin_008258 [Ulmus minor]